MPTTRARHTRRLWRRQLVRARSALPEAAPGRRGRSVRVPRQGDETDAAGLGRIRASAFVVPALLLVGAFLVFPAMWTLYLGLTDYRLTGIAAAHPQFVGLS